jgi:hypothetical protein
MPHLFNITYQYTPKNKLEKAIQELLLKQDRKLLMSELEATKFRDDVLAWIDGLCKQHPKCKPIKPHWYRYANPKGHGDYYLHEVNVLNASLVEGKV